MGLAILKPGQGYWTRVLSAIGAGILLLAGAHWVSWDQGAAWHLYTKIGVALGIIIVIGAFLYRVMNKPRVVDFMIATEGEMKKVNWPSKKEIIGSTWVVIAGTLIIAAILFVVDLFFGWLFLLINILEN